MYSDDSEYLKSLRKSNHYHFSIPFEYIEKNYGEGNYDISTTNMEVDVNWDDSQNGYVITHDVPEMNMIDPNEGNSDEQGFYDCGVEEIVLNRLSSMGIGAEALVGGDGRSY